MTLYGKYIVILNIPYYFKNTGEKYIIPIGMTECRDEGVNLSWPATKSVGDSLKRAAAPLP